MDENYNIIELANGIRIVHRQIKHSRIVHCGLMTDTGTRDENDKNNGIAHFIEHMVFKGTEKRKTYHILNRLEAVGGELNAFTTREKTCFYTASLKRYARRAVDLLTDITFNPVFPKKEIEKEKRVIMEEIEMYEDTPEENIYDDYFAEIYKNHPLGYNILGTKERVRSFQREDILQFISENYSLDKMVLSIIGNITPEKVAKIAENYLSPLSSDIGKRKRKPPPQYEKFFIKKDKDFQQTYCIMGTRAYDRYNNKRYALNLLNNILGGEGMNSRLNLSIREKYGYVYQINSNYTALADTGLFFVELSSDDKYIDKCIDLIYKEFKKLREKKLGTLQLNQAKRQLLGQAAMMEENHSIMMQSQARSILNHDRVITLDEFFEKIESVTAEEIQDVANEILIPGNISTLIFSSSKGKG